MSTRVLAPPRRVFDVSLSVELHTASMARSGERAVGGVTSGQLAAGDRVTWQARHWGRWGGWPSGCEPCHRPARTGRAGCGVCEV
ncbi:hypothetical protein [Nonomuraea sp. NPDC023979]|uniref:hypothetical protein n=1 Tax=Nonomuraea sp. NPDC023979 TaxID=3154796 RepID=UPI0033EA218C